MTLMEDLRDFAPIFCYVVDVEPNQLVLSRTIVYEESNLIRSPSFVNESGQDIKKGDRILYLEAYRKDGQLPIVKKVVAHNFPTAPTIGDLLKELKWSICTEYSKLEAFLPKLLGLPLTFTTRDKASVIIDADGTDSGHMFCPFNDFLKSIEPPPFCLKVPVVSAETLAFVRRASKQAADDETTILALLSLRVIHALLHSLGFKEHTDLKVRIEEHEAWKRGDPSLAASALKTQCIMDWGHLPLMAGTYDGKQTLQPLQTLFCSNCQGEIRELAGIGMKDMDMITEIFLPEVKEKIRQRKQAFYHVVYVLARNQVEVLIGLAPFDFGKVVEASTETTMEQIDSRLLHGCALRVPLKMIHRNSPRLEKGLKLLAEIHYSIGEHDYLFHDVQMVEKLGKLTIKRSGGSDSVNLAVRVKWGSSVNISDLSQAAKQVQRFTGLRVNVDGKPDAQIDSAMAKIKSALQKEQKITKDLVYRLQDIMDTIQPTVADVLDKPVIVMLVLPWLGIPISTIGQLAVGEAKSKMYILFAMPKPIKSVQLLSKACAQCPYNYSQGKSVDYASYLATFMSHEVMHLIANVNDHRGECDICYLNNDVYQSLRFGFCERCIRDSSNKVHQNCIMGYACQSCLTSRLAQARDKSDFLCDECRSRLIPPSDYIARYYYNIHRNVYTDLVLKHAEKFNHF